MGGRGGPAVQQHAVRSGGSDDGPLAWNVAGLLADDPGADRIYEAEDVTIDLGEDLRTALALQCSRCLRDIELPVEIRFQEEYLPALDLTTGRPLPVDDEPDVARLTDHHELDLETPVREAIQLAEPIAPLHSPDCQGLCVVCGLPLEDGEHDHPVDDIDPRLEALRGFTPDDG